MSVKKTISVNKSFEIARQQIENKEYSFFMRSKDQEEYKPKNVGSFIEDRYRYAYIIQDMASLVTSNEICHFLSEISYKLRCNEHYKISNEHLSLAIKFIKDSAEEYKNIHYVDLTKSAVV